MVRTRFAPSPTGYLHIGGVRTALFNWLFARRHGGQFILRIDDTDQGRNQPEALQPILDGFRWLGLDWDEGAEVGGPYGPYFQSERLDRYQAAVKALLDRGLAYHDYATSEEMKAEREAAEKGKRSFLYSRKWLAESAADRARFESEGRKGVVRLKMPREGVCRFHDHIRGDMEVPWITEQDHVVQRADGSCLYNLANVVDDHDMRITHVIRAEEHLSNTPRQIFIAQGLGYELPEYAHVPFVAEPGSKNKLSKRKLAQYLKNPDFRNAYEHGRAIADAIGLTATADTFNPVIVDFYREVGYLPDAIVNYLLLLGWSLDDKTEFFTRSEMIGHFSLERVNKAPASFDIKKLRAFQERYMALVPIERKTELVLPFLQKAKLISEPTPADVKARVTEIVRAAGERIKVAGDILDYAAFFLPDDRLTYDEKAFTQYVRKPEANALLRKMRDRLALATFEAKALEELVQNFAESEGV
jgi:glutamyl-tRNA synthetase